MESRIVEDVHHICYHGYCQKETPPHPPGEKLNWARTLRSQPNQCKPCLHIQSRRVIHLMKWRIRNWPNTNNATKHADGSYYLKSADRNWTFIKSGQKSRVLGLLQRRHEPMFLFKLLCIFISPTQESSVALLLSDFGIEQTVYHGMVIDTLYPPQLNSIGMTETNNEMGRHPSL